MKADRNVPITKIYPVCSKIYSINTNEEEDSHSYL